MIAKRPAPPSKHLSLASDNTERYWRPMIVDNITKDMDPKLRSRRVPKLSLPDNIDHKYGAPDPFIVSDGSDTWIFAEMVDKKSQNGELGVARFNQESLTFRTVIKESYHLSFPNVFKHDNEWYMIPESYKSGRIILYRAIEFPYKWEKLQTIWNQDGMDSIPFQLGKKWYLFTTLVSTQRSFILTTDRFPTGKWTKVKSDPLPEGYRGGGNAIYRFDKVILPIQPVVPGAAYGSALSLYSIDDELNMKKEVQFAQFSHSKGMHHMSYDPSKNTTIIDVREFHAADTNKDKKLSRAEWVAHFGSDKHFDEYDSDHDGLVDADEFMKGKQRG